MYRFMCAGFQQIAGKRTPKKTVGHKYSDSEDSSSESIEEYFLFRILAFSVFVDFRIQKRLQTI